MHCHRENARFFVWKWYALWNSVVNVPLGGGWGEWGVEVFIFQLDRWVFGGFGGLSKDLGFGLHSCPRVNRGLEGMAQWHSRISQKTSEIMGHLSVVRKRDPAIVGYARRFDAWARVRRLRV